MQIGDFRLDRATGELAGPAGATRLEPKVMELLVLLAANPGQVLGRERIVEALWPQVVVGDDSLARTVSKLRQALGDDARQPRYIETLSKRGYRLLAPVATAGGAGVAKGAARARYRTGLAFAALAAVLAIVAASAWHLAGGDRPAGTPSAAEAALLQRAGDYYFQFSRGDNERAIELYQRVLELQPDDPAALAGLANALVQRSLRWPTLPQGPSGEPAPEFTRLRDALGYGHLARDPARQQLQRARRLAERAVEVAPQSAAAHKARGFVASAQGEFDVALAAYRRTVDLDPAAWGAMINSGDVLEITGRDAAALPWYERAFAAMETSYQHEPARVRPWHPELGVLLAERHRARGDPAAAEHWYRRALAIAPLHPEATAGLSRLLREGGDAAAAERLCQELAQRTGEAAGCDGDRAHLAR